MKRFAVNGKEQAPDIQKGYAVVTRQWKPGDRIELELPMEPQRAIADDRIKADLGSTALKYGPLVYNVETVDNKRIDQGLGDLPLRTEWRKNLLGGVMAICGSWEDGSPMLAIPNYARMNRIGPPPAYPGEAEADQARSVTNASRRPNIDSKVWI